ncbi:MAG: RNase adapter RapZ [Polyangiaceae bacterium]
MTGSNETPSQSMLAASKPLVVVLTGLSGAGKSTALRALEDLGFFCVDNLPTLLAPRAVELCEEGGMTKVALGMDVRVRSFLPHIGAMLAELEANGQRDLTLVFLDASDEALLRRFNETRRPHPLNANLVEVRERGGALAVLDGVHLERERLAPLRARANRVIDTTALSVHDLRRVILTQLGPASSTAPRMLTRVVSFGFKYGAPVDADLVFDVRFLDNPYFVPELKALSGNDEACATFVLGQEEAKEFLTKTEDLLAYVTPKYEREGKSYLTIAIGCTGGRHRSVAIANEIASRLAKDANAPVVVLHRDVARGETTTKIPEPPTSSPRLEMPSGESIDVPPQSMGWRNE